MVQGLQEPWPPVEFRRAEASQSVVPRWRKTKPCPQAATPLPILLGLTLSYLALPSHGRRGCKIISRLQTRVPTACRRWDKSLGRDFARFRYFVQDIQDSCHSRPRPRAITVQRLYTDLGNLKFIPPSFLLLPTSSKVYYNLLVRVSAFSTRYLLTIYIYK